MANFDTQRSDFKILLSLIAHHTKLINGETKYIDGLHANSFFVLLKNLNVEHYTLCLFRNAVKGIMSEDNGYLYGDANDFVYLLFSLLFVELKNIEFVTIFSKHFKPFANENIDNSNH